MITAYNAKAEQLVKAALSKAKLAESDEVTVSVSGEVTVNEVDYEYSCDVLLLVSSHSEGRPYGRGTASERVAEVRHAEVVGDIELIPDVDGELRATIEDSVKEAATELASDKYMRGEV